MQRLSVRALYDAYMHQGQNMGKIKHVNELKIRKLYENRKGNFKK